MSKRKRTYKGSIYKPKANNRLYIEYKGKRTATGLLATTEGYRLAERILEKMVLESHGLIAKVDDQPEEMGVKEAFGEFLRKHCLNKEPKTVHGYKDAFKIVTLDQQFALTIKNVEEAAIHFVKTTHLSDASINIHLRAYQVFVNFCTNQKFLPQELNVFKNYRKKVTQKIVFALSPKQQTALIEYFKKDVEFCALIEFQIETGFRIGQTLSLKLSEIDFAKKIIRRKSKNKLRNESFPITEHLKKIIDRVPKNEKGKLFLWNSASKLTSKFNAGLKAIGITDASGLHILRKTAATNWIRSGMTQNDVKNLMGHTDFSLTSDIYAMFEVDNVRKSMNASRIL